MLLKWMVVIIKYLNTPISWKYSLRTEMDCLKDTFGFSGSLTCTKDVLKRGFGLKLCLSDFAYFRHT